MPSANDTILRGGPFDVLDDDDKLREECGVFGVWNVENASKFAALGLHALQHRGQEAAGIVSYGRMSDKYENDFHIERNMGYVSEAFSKVDVEKDLPGNRAIGHTRYSTAGKKGRTESRDIQPLYVEMPESGFVIAHNGNLTNAESMRARLIGRGSIFQSSSDTENILHLTSRGLDVEGSLLRRLQEALRKVEGAYSIVAMTDDKMVGVRDPRGMRPLVLGKLGDGWVLASETCALDIMAAKFVRDVKPGEMVVITDQGVESSFPFTPMPSKFCVFEYVYFSRPDSVIGGQNVYEARRRIGEELAKEDDAQGLVPKADLVCPIPDSGTPAAIGYARATGIPFEMGVIRNQFIGRTFIEPTDAIREAKVRMKLNVNSSLVKDKSVILVDDSVVRGTTSRAIKDMVKAAGAREVHFRVASPPTKNPCFYGVDTPSREKLMAAQMSVERMCQELGVDSLRFISLEGLFRACGLKEPRNDIDPQFCDACFSGKYPTNLSDATLRRKAKVGDE